MNHFGSRVVSLLLAVLFLLGAAGVSFYAVFKGTLVFATTDPEVESIEITDVEENTLLPINVEKKIEITVVDKNITTADYNNNKDSAIFSFENNKVLKLSTESAKAPKFGSGTSAADGGCKYTITFYAQLAAEASSTKGTITYSGNQKSSFTIRFSEWIAGGEANKNSEAILQNYRFEDDNGKKITRLVKDQHISKLVVTIKETGVTKDQYDNAAKDNFTASLNYTVFKPDDRGNLPIFSEETINEFSDGISYTIIFTDLTYTGDEARLTLRVGYPAAFGLDNRRIDIDIPEGVEDGTSSASLQSYRFYDEDGDRISRLSKNKKISELELTIKDNGFTKDDYDSASKSGFTASINSSAFKFTNKNEEADFGATAHENSDGSVSYTITFHDLRYTGDKAELLVLIGYPRSFGLEIRKITIEIPEGELSDSSSSSSSSSEDSSSEVEIDPPTPRLIIKSYDYGGENVSAGSTATLNLTFQNMSKRVPVDNVVVKVTMPEGFTLADSSNSFYFERIGREREESISINFTVKPTAEAISQSIKLNFAFEAIIANKRTPLTSDEEIAIPVSQVNRMMLNSVETPPEIYIGDNSNSIEASFVNKGKTAVYNVTASIEGENLAQVGQTQFIGNVESGIEKSADFSLEALEAGPVKGEIILTYEDANMHVTELRTPFSTQAQEMDMGPTQEELDAMNQPQTEPTVSTAWYETIPAWYWAVGGLVALIVLAYLVKLTRVSRLTILEDDDEDF